VYSTETITQQASGCLRRYRVCETSLNVPPVFHRQSRQHLPEHLEGIAVISSLYVYCPTALWTCLSSFEPVTINEVRKMLSATAMPSKSSSIYVLPCSLLKSCTDVFAPVITRMANLSLQAGKFPAKYKTVQVLPLLKKPGLDSPSPVNYRPISNLLTVSKLLEHLVLACLHLLRCANFSQFQSAYRKGYSTKRHCWMPCSWLPAFCMQNLLFIQPRCQPRTYFFNNYIVLSNINST